MRCKIYPILFAILAMLAKIYPQQIWPFPTGEQLVYETNFGVAPVGMTEMTIDSTSPGKLTITSLASTLPLFDRLFKIRDTLQVEIDRNNLGFRSMIRKINEGNYRLRDTSRVDLSHNLIYTRRDTLPYPGTVYDPMGIIYYLRTIPLVPGDVVEILLFNGKAVRAVRIDISEAKNVTVPAGVFDCFVMRPTPLDGKPMTKGGGLVTVWLSQDRRRLPVRIQQKANFGTVILKLAHLP